jgi:hypothetical protein
MAQFVDVQAAIHHLNTAPTRPHVFPLLLLLLLALCVHQVPDPEQQHRVMIEAVENHMPQVVVIDEIGTEAECSAARTIAQVRGDDKLFTSLGLCACWCLCGVSMWWR